MFRVEARPQSETIGITPVQTGLLQRAYACGQHTGGSECAECHKKREGTLQCAAVNAAPVNEVPSIVHEALRSPSQPLDLATRAFMEPRFGHDFSRVRVHTDAKAAESARAVNALAYTVGRDVVFGKGRYAPQSSAGQRLIAHELTHVIQQGNAAWTSGALQLGAPDTSHEQEARNASQPEMAAPARSVPARSAAPLGTIQRHPPDFGSLFLRRREDGRIEILYGTPDVPVTGPLGVGIRCQNGRCQPVGGQDPSSVEHRTYTLQEAIDLLRGGSSATPSGPSCPSERQIPQLAACCPVGMMWNDRACVPLSASLPPLCPPTQMSPRGICCPSGERWDFIANRCAPPSPIGQPGVQAPQFTLPRLQLGTTSMRFGTIESSTFDNFHSDDATVPPQHNAALDHLASLLNIYREVEVHIEGHTDSTASEAHNDRLSVNRAEAVRAALVARNVVNPSRLHTQGFGERQLRLQPERTEADKAGNRRVEVWFYTPPSQSIGSQLQLPPPLMTAP